MKRVCTLTIGTLGLLCLGVVLSAGEVFAQTAKDLAGTWTLVSNVTEQGGKKTDTFGPNPKGLLVFTDDGRFIYLLSRADLPKFASNNRTTGTPEENTAVVRGSVSTYGTYSLADKTLTIKVEHSTFPNWIGTDQQRTITITGDEMKWTNPAGSGGGVVELVLRRAK